MRVGIGDRDVDPGARSGPGVLRWRRRRADHHDAAAEAQLGVSDGVVGALERRVQAGAEGVGQPPHRGGRVGVSDGREDVGRRHWRSFRQIAASVAGGRPRGLGEILPGADERRGRHPGKLPEVVHEVGLVVVAVRHRQIGPAHVAARAETGNQAVEPDDPGKLLRADADVFAELRDEVLLTPADLPRERFDSQRAAAPAKRPPGPFDFRRRLDRARDARESPRRSRRTPHATSLPAQGARPGRLASSPSRSRSSTTRLAIACMPTPRNRRAPSAVKLS